MTAALLDLWCCGTDGIMKLPEMDVRSALARMFSAKSKPSFPAEPGGPLGEVAPPLRGSSIAFAPKLLRLLKGVTGVDDDMLDDMADGGGSSSNGDSSTDPELALDTDSALARIVLYGEVVAAGIVDRPRVVMERRLGWFDWALGGGLGPKRSTKDERRRPPAGGESRGLDESDDMLFRSCWLKVTD